MKHSAQDALLTRTHPCGYCGSPHHVVMFPRPGSLPGHMPVRLCVVCLARIIDRAMDWRVTNTVLIGLSHRAAGQELRAARAAKTR